MEQKLLGELFGVEIHYPTNRDEIRQAAKAGYEYQGNLTSHDNLSFDQARLDTQDIMQNFFNGLDEKISNEVSEIYCDELLAVISDTSHQSYKGERVSMGLLFGVEITKPFDRKEIRELVKTRNHLMQERAVGGLTLHQTSLDLSDEMHAFVSGWSAVDQTDFYNLTTEETNALTSSINDKTSRFLIHQAEQSMAMQWVIGIIAIIVIFVIFASR